MRIWRASDSVVMMRRSFGWRDERRVLHRVEKDWGVSSWRKGSLLEKGSCMAEDD